MTFDAITVQQAWARQPIDFPALMSADRFDDADRFLQDKYAAIHDEASEAEFDGCMQSFHAYMQVSAGTRLVLDKLDDWKLALPGSAMPWLLRTRYWAHLAYEVRGDGMAHTVGKHQWAVAFVLRDAAVLAALKTLERDPSIYHAFSRIINVVGAFGEPEWLARWLDQGIAPKAADTALPTHLQGALSALRMGPGEMADVDVKLSEPLVRLQARRDELLRLGGEKHFWVEAALASHPYARVAVEVYLHFATERWGGSDERLTAFLDSPQCERFSEADKSGLRFNYQFYDKIVGENVDPDNRRHDLSVCKRALRRPLPDWAMAEVKLRLARIHDANANEFDAGSPQRAELLAKAEAEIAAAAPWIGNEPHDLVFLIEFWLVHARDKSWMAVIAQRKCLHHAHAAMLHGLMLEHGWGGLPKRPDLSTQWYDQAAACMPPGEGDAEDPYKVSFLPLCEQANDSESPRSMLEHGAARGYPCALFRLAYISEQAAKAGVAGAEERMLIHYRKAADLKYWPAIFNLVAHHSNRAVTLHGTPEGLEHKYLAVAQAVRLLDLCVAADEVDESYDHFPDAMLGFLKGQLVWDCRRYDNITDLMVPHLKAHAEGGVILAMCAMALLHGLKSDKRFYDYREAVRWITAAKKLDAEHPVVIDTDEAIEGESIWSRFKYAYTAGKIPSHELPGQGDQGLL